MAKNSDYISVFRPAKVAALVRLGHRPEGMARVGSAAVVFFPVSDALRADLTAIDDAQAACIAMMRGELPVDPQALVRAARKEP